MSLLAELMSVDVLNLIGLLAVVFIGLPHGAMDGALAIHLGWMNRPIKAATFLLAYVGLAALVVGHLVDCPNGWILDVLGHQSVSFRKGRHCSSSQRTPIGRSLDARRSCVGGD